MEALELGCTSLLIDEDTCATNFMIRDLSMQALVAADKEPITTFIRKVKPLFKEEGVSTVMVIGGSGDFFPLADTVIMMERYVAYDVTTRAHEIAKTHSREAPPSVSGFGTGAKRVLQKDGLAADGKVMAKSLRCITYGEQEIELTYVEQLVEISQARAIADAIKFLSSSGYVDGKATLTEIITRLEEMLMGEEVG